MRPFLFFGLAQWGLVVRFSEFAITRYIRNCSVGAYIGQKCLIVGGGISGYPQRCGRIRPQISPGCRKYQLNDEKLATHGEKDLVIAGEDSEIGASL
jgi:hypothetical protein